ncbi:MAG: extradiol dioxygenase [Bryobacteraceae bacterium]|jgi:catechol 2,3-dioxygenase-like lactoylglutathione lyase family enzyme
MITGAHILLYSSDPEADRAFFRDVLEFPSVDAGHGWLIFKLPPAEAALHPVDGASGAGLLGAELYLMCDDLQALIQSLAARNVICKAIDRAPWGIKTTITLPSGGELGLYQPTHPTAIGI